MQGFDYPLVIAGIVVIALATSATCAYLWLQLKSQTRRVNRLEHLFNKELTIMTQSQAAMGKRIIDVENMKAEVSSKPSQSESSVIEDQSESEFNFQEKLHSGSYNSALNLLKKGMSSDDVAKRCGLSKAEASLMQLVNNKSPVDH